MAASRFILVSLHPQGEKMSFPCNNDAVTVSSLQSVFPQATGLKHLHNGAWQVVSVEAGKFHLPTAVESFVVISGCIDQARQMTAPSLARQLARTFRPAVPSPRFSAVTSNIRRNTQTGKRTATGNSKTKTYKVVFIKEVELPVKFSRDLFLLEGIIDIPYSDEEPAIMQKLKEVLNEFNFSDLKILTFNMKTLSMPQCGAGLAWNGPQIRTLVGQGKLYVMVKGYQDDGGNERDSSISEEPTSEPTLPDPCRDPTLPDPCREPTLPDPCRDPTLPGPCRLITGNLTVRTTHPGQSATNSDDDDFCELGTPTVMRNKRKIHVPIQLSDSDSSHDTEKEDSKCFLLSDAEGSDADIQAALAESLRPKKHFSEALKHWTDAKLERDHSPALLVISRNHLLDSTNRALARKGFSFQWPVKVCFSGEDGEDYGGPRREYFSLLMKVLESRIIQGGFLVHNIQRLEQREYFLAGRYIVWSILQGGPGFPFFERCAVQMMLNPDEMKLNIENAPYHERPMLEKLQVAETVDEEMSDWLISLGLSPLFNIDQRNDLLQMSLRQILYYRIHAEICQFKEGLRSFNFLDVMVEYPSGLETLLCNTPVEVSFEQVKKMISINFSEEGSNMRPGEVNTVYAFDTFLQDCLDGSLEVTFEDLLSFWTGAKTVPPLGFHKKMEINFIFDTSRLPVAHTCEMSLELARNLSPEEMLEKMTKAIQWGGQFHLA